MKQFFLTLIVAVMSFGFVVTEAEAKRLGGGSSFGMQRQATPPAQRQPSATQQQAPAAGAATAAAQPKRSWMGPIAGLAAGLGLAALFSALGLGEGFANFVMILLLAAAAFFVFRLIFRRGANAAAQQPASAPAGTPTKISAADFASPALADDPSAAAWRAYARQGKALKSGASKVSAFNVDRLRRSIGNSTRSG